MPEGDAGPTPGPTAGPGLHPALRTPLQELTGILLALEIDGVIAENPPGMYMALS